MWKGKEGVKSKAEWRGKPEQPSSSTPGRQWDQVERILQNHFLHFLMQVLERGGYRRERKEDAMALNLTRKLWRECTKRSLDKTQMSSVQSHSNYCRDWWNFERVSAWKEDTLNQEWWVRPTRTSTQWMGGFLLGGCGGVCVCGWL